MNHPAERDIEREAFEKWAKESLPEYCNPRAPTWEIVEANVRAEAWAAWQARAAQATAEPVADPRLEDLRYIVERLARKLAKADPNSGEPSGALIYLRRVGLTGSPLRTAPDRAPTAESGIPTIRDFRSVAAPDRAPGALDRFLAAAAEAKITHLAIPVAPDRAPSTTPAYAPKFDEAEFTKMVEHGSKVWGGEPDNIADILRGRAPSTDSAAGWQPIETAPKDGKEILVCRNVDANGQPMGDSFGLFVQRASWWEGDNDWIVYCSLIREPHVFFAPTHWMPIPAPPPIAAMQKEG